MLTDRFYVQLATLLRDGAAADRPLIVAVGRGLANWDRFPPVPQRDVPGLQAEAARVRVAAEDIAFIDAEGNPSRRATPILRVIARFDAGAASGTLRECGLLSGVRGRSPGELLAYFVHPRLDLQADATLERSFTLDLRPGRTRAEEHVTQFLGNSRTEEFHDLERLTPGCQVEEIRADRRHYFASEDEARSFGYDYCARCFGRELSER